ncbi:hypothetical protein CWE15_04940 [Aliidiomarina taiwanensis]|uniref:Flagellar basal-body/hook protein C-terminal domain-containing protein n=1 Tax=Aliidiomarina taiwanensis TaxID=946228 RepID=A0A432X7C7_9GAMM|nr:hypothetical protein [Aliidiomarina taiwanensis]RUO42758.1 hypothetical protein CWE15_04940 [Aliidiomarina taiwanensis]
MNIDSSLPAAFTSAAQGMQRSTQQVASASQYIAREDTPKTSAITELLEGELTYQANAKTLSVSSGMLGTLIDIKV